MRKLSKLFFLFIVFISIIFLSSCDRNLNSFAFIEGKFIYEGYPFVLYDDISVDQMVIEFSSYEGDVTNLEYNEGISEYLGDECDTKNLIQNSFNKKIYQIKLYFKLYNSEEYIHTNVYSIETFAFADGSDVYKIRVDIVDIHNELNYYFKIRLIPTYEENPNYYILLSLLEMYKDDLLVNNIQNTTEFKSIKDMKSWYLYLVEE